MKLAGEYTFDAPQDVVWEALQDPEVLAAIMPGCEKLELVGENEYEGALKIKVGPVQGKFNGNVKLTDINAPDSYNMMVDGKGASGFVKGQGGLKLTGQGDKTLMVYEGEAQVGGRIASVGQRLLDSSAKAITKQSLESLNNLLTAQIAAVAAAEAVTSGGASGTEAPPPVVQVEVKAPSQIGFAAGVAHEMVNDLVPARYRPLLIAAGLMVIAAILYLLLARR